MKFLILALMGHFSLSLYAQTYDGLEMKACPEPVCRGLLKALSTHGFRPVNGTAGLPSIGVNYLLFGEDLNEYITIKYDVKGKFKINTLEHLPGAGEVIHLQTQHATTGIFFSNISANRVRFILNDLKKMEYKTTLLDKLNPIQVAHADTCSSEIVVGQEFNSPMKEVSKFTVMNGLMNCMKGASTGAVDAITAIPNHLISGLSFIKKQGQQLWTNPSKKLNDYYKAVDRAVMGFKNVVLLLTECLLDPVKGSRLLAEKFGEMGAYLGKITESFAAMPIEMAIDFTCSLVAGFGVDAFITAMTGGAAALVVMKSLQRTMQAMKRMESMFKIAGKLKNLSEIGLDQITRNKIFKALKVGKLKERTLGVFSDSVTSQSNLARSFALRGLRCELQ